MEGLWELSSTRTGEEGHLSLLPPLLLLSMSQLLLQIWKLSSKGKATSQQGKSGLKSNSPNFKARKCSFFPTRLLDKTNSKAHT